MVSYGGAWERGLRLSLSDDKNALDSWMMLLDEYLPTARSNLHKSWEGKASHSLAPSKTVKRYLKLKVLRGTATLTPLFIPIPTFQPSSTT